MQNIEYKISLERKITLRGTVKYKGKINGLFNERIPVEIIIETDMSFRISAPGLKTHAVGQTLEDTFCALFDEILFLKHKGDTLCHQESNPA